MAETKTNVRASYSVNASVYKAKQERRIEKSNYPPAQKLETVRKLRDTARSLQSAELVEQGRIVKD